MGKLENTFSWSWSRHRAFSACLRRYWFQHYGFWGGWDPDAPPEQREVYIQKRLNTRPQWVGTQVHEAAEWLLKEARKGHFHTREAATARAERKARQMVADSERGAYRGKPKWKPGFVEHYYDHEDPPEVWEQAISEISRQVAGLFDNPVFLRLGRVPGRIAEIEDLKQLQVGDVPVWVSLDVLVRDGDGGFVIIDWKTGRGHDPEQVVAQMGIYGLYVLTHWMDVAPDQASEELSRVRLIHANLRDGVHEVHPLTPEAVEQALQTVRSSAAEMRALLDDPGKNVARKEAFPTLPEDDPACLSCVYRRSCGRESGQKLV